MRTTLRRSCDACAKAKHGCDLQTPSCSRCIKRKCHCVYANEPLTLSSNAHPIPSEGARTSRLTGSKNGEALSIPATNDNINRKLSDSAVTLVNPANASFDPFDSYPPTRLPRVHVQRLIYHFLSNIAFLYYPLDLSSQSNPFVVSWWPLALADPALFHVSLQTASLDEESRAQKGFPISELLMMDSVSLVRQKIEDPSLAYQNETLDSVVTLAAIEHGKGNVETSTMHIEAIKRMVRVRGGINEIKGTSPLTARMVSWVSMLVMEAPQFQTQDDFGFGDGLGPILQWQLASTNPDCQDRAGDDLDADPAITDIITRLRSLFHEPWASSLSNTDLHDLTSFVVHRLLLLPPVLPPNSKRSAVSESLRYTTVLYMFIIHGTTYYSHIYLANTIIFQLKAHLDFLVQTGSNHNSLEIWVLSIGMATTVGITDHRWLIDQASAAATALELHTWEDVLVHLESILWMKTQQDGLFRALWEDILNAVAI